MGSRVLAHIVSTYYDRIPAHFIFAARRNVRTAHLVFSTTFTLRVGLLLQPPCFPYLQLYT